LTSTSETNGRERLLAADVDGTLLRTDGVLSHRTREAVRAADRAGWHVALVTGRPLPYVLPVVRELGVGEYVVAANGATVAEISSRAVLYQANLPGRLVLDALVRARLAVPGIRLAATTARGFLAEPGFDELAPLSRADAVVVDDASPRPDDAVNSAVLFMVGADTADVLVRVAAVVPPGIDVSPSGLPGSVELTAPGVHKGSGLAHLCRRLGVAPTDVIAFGDGLNDNEMLRWAGRGVAMGNADAGTKAVADEVTASNDDEGVALVLERLLVRDIGRSGGGRDRSCADQPLGDQPGLGDEAPPSETEEDSVLGQP
jgi:hydroxymethylpyrimidine pyrophosphatase-like HAD family hydrolase